MKGSEIKAIYNFLNGLYSKSRRTISNFLRQGSIKKRNNTIEKLSLIRGGIVQALVSCNIQRITD